jgi:hypothetical protein
LLADLLAGNDLVAVLASYSQLAEQYGDAVRFSLCDVEGTA